MGEHYEVIQEGEKQYGAGETTGCRREEKQYGTGKSTDMMSYR